MLFFPIVPLVIKYFNKLSKSSSKDNPNSATDAPQSPSPSTITEEDSISTTGGGSGVRTGAKRSLMNDLNSGKKGSGRGYYGHMGGVTMVELF